MKKEELKNSWEQVKTTLKQKFALSEKDLNYVEGKEDELYEHLQTKLGKSRGEVDKIIQSVHSSVKAKEKPSQDKK